MRIFIIIFLNLMLVLQFSPKKILAEEFWVSETRYLQDPFKYYKIQDAINDADHDDIIWVDGLDGQLYDENIYLSSKYNITIKSIQGKNYCTIRAVMSGPVIVGDSTTYNITIDGFTIVSPFNDIGITFYGGAYNINIKNCDIVGCSQGVSLNNTSSAVVEDCEIKQSPPGTYKFGVIGYNAALTEVKGCIISDLWEGISMNYNSGIKVSDTEIARIEHDGVYVQNNSTGLVDNCLIRECGFGIPASGYSPVTIRNTRIRNIDSIGIWGNINSIVEKCSIKQCKQQGIYSRGIATVEVYDTEISGCGSDVPPKADAIANNFGGDLKMVNCLVKGNPGGGIGVFEASPKIINCTVVMNSKYGIGSSCFPGGTTRPEIINCIIAINEIGIDARNPSAPIITYSDVWNNGVDYSGNCGPGEGCISKNPYFKAYQFGDFHIVKGSPCIDAGTDADPAVPAIDIEGALRPQGEGIDMGAYEYYSSTLPVIFPIRNRVSKDPTPTFEWGSADIGTEAHYKFEIADDMPFNENIIYAMESKENTAGFVPLPPIVPGKGTAFYTMLQELAEGDYYWRVSAWDGEEYSPPSEIRKLTIDLSP